MKELKDLIYKLVGYTVGVLVGNGIIMWVYNSVVPDVFGLSLLGIGSCLGYIWFVIICLRIIRILIIRTIKYLHIVKNTC